MNLYCPFESFPSLQCFMPFYGMKHTDRTLDHALAFFDGFFDGANHVERLFWQVVQFA